MLERLEVLGVRGVQVFAFRDQLELFVPNHAGLADDLLERCQPVGVHDPRR